MPRLEPLPLEGHRGSPAISGSYQEPHGPSAQFAADYGAAPGDTARLPAAGNGDKRPELDDHAGAAQQGLAVASRAAGCGYCMAHTAHTATRVGIPPEKEEALWEYETSPLFSAAKRAALRVAQGAAQVPNAVSDDDFAELKRYYTEAQIVDIVAVIALLNRFNDTMATELESSPIAAGQRFLAARGWTVGKHAR
jgi:alkylhydroperoxidase family enzyme